MQEQPSFTIQKGFGQPPYVAHFGGKSQEKKEIHSSIEEVLF